MKVLKYLSLSVVVFWDVSLGADSFITDGFSIVAYGQNGAFLVSTSGLLLQWNDIVGKWISVAQVNGSNIKQMDSLSDGTKVLGTDEANHARLWNLQIGDLSNWSSPRGNNTYDWVKIDPVTNSTVGSKKGLSVCEQRDIPSPGGGDPWYKYKSAGPKGSPEMTQYLLVDNHDGTIRRWDREDMDQEMALNMNGATDPFKIYYFGSSASSAMNKMMAPPTGNPDTVLIQQISYDELYQNLWAIDVDGKPWHWDNSEQKWVLCDIRGPGGYVPPIPPVPFSGQKAALAQLMKEHTDYYVQVTYISGLYTPVLVVFRDTKLMHLIIGEDQNFDTGDLQIIILDSPKPRAEHHNILLRPKDSPEKIVRIDGGKRRQENHYLETLLLANGVVTNVDNIAVYPADKRIIRR